MVCGWSRTSCATRSRVTIRSSPRPRGTSSTPAASGSGPCSCCWPRGSVTRPPPAYSPRLLSLSSLTSRRSITTTSWTRRCSVGVCRRRTRAGTTPSPSSRATSSSLARRTCSRTSGPRPCASRPARSNGWWWARSARRSGPADGADPVQHYLSVVADKTGSLIATSGRFGAMLSGADPDVVETLTGYGERIGVAFQLSDDLLDVSSEAAESGKTPGTDLREGVATLPVLHVRRSEDPADDRLRAAARRPPGRRRRPRRSPGPASRPPCDGDCAYRGPAMRRRSARPAQAAARHPSSRRARVAVRRRRRAHRLDAAQPAATGSASRAN